MIRSTDRILTTHAGSLSRPTALIAANAAREAGQDAAEPPMRDILGAMLEVDAGAYSFEAGDVRHEHEWKVGEDIAPPEGKVIAPGVVSHATDVVERPELVADRIERFARAAGRENVIASTDCGLGGRIRPQITSARLETLVAGAELASERPWA